MANEQNLKPVRNKDEARERGKKGGKASGKARRERKSLKEELLLLLDSDENQDKMCLALVRQAMRGNTKAFEIVRDTIGEKPVESIEINKDTAVTIAGIEAHIAKRRGE